MQQSFPSRAQTPRAVGAAVRALLRCGGCLVLGCAAYSVVLHAWAEHLAHSVSLVDREQAARLASEPAFYELLAQKREETGVDPLPALREAARLEPSNPFRWLQLATAAEWSGDTGMAGSCFRRAADLSRLYLPRYLLAQYYFRQQDRAAFFFWAQAALEKAYGDVSPLLDLCRRMQPDALSFARQGAVAPGPTRRQFLAFLVQRHEIPAAAELARRLADEASSEDLASLYGFCDLALSNANPAAAETVWNALCLRKRIPYESLAPDVGVSLTNPKLEFPAIGAGFDWHIEPCAGIRIVQRRGEWRVNFSGEEPESCLLAWQYVPLVTKRRYRIHVDSGVFDEPGARGIGWSLVYPSAGGNWPEWMPGREAEFFAPAPVIRLALIYRRPVGSPRLMGTAWIRAVHLELQP